MAIRVIRSGTRVPGFVRGSLAWHTCAVCGGLWDRSEHTTLMRDGEGNGVGAVCPDCRYPLTAAGGAA